MEPTARTFRVLRPTAGEVLIEFPRWPGVTALLVLALGLGITGFLGAQLVQAVRNNRGTTKYGFGLGLGVVATGMGVLLLAGRSHVRVTGSSVAYRLMVARYACLNSEVPKREVETIQAEEEGGPCIRIYPRSGSRTHVEGFRSKEERDWFLSELLKAMKDPDGAFRT